MILEEEPEVGDGEGDGGGEGGVGAHNGGGGGGIMPPSNYAMVSWGIYRSGLPNPDNFGFLETLGLRSIVSVFSFSQFLVFNFFLKYNFGVFLELIG